MNDIEIINILIDNCRDQIKREIKQTFGSTLMDRYIDSVLEGLKKQIPEIKPNLEWLASKYNLDKIKEIKQIDVTNAPSKIFIQIVISILMGGKTVYQKWQNDKLYVYTEAV